jgi:hypothetical protein
MPPHKWNAQKRADRERAVAMYRDSLARPDLAALASGDAPADAN